MSLRARTFVSIVVAVVLSWSVQAVLQHWSLSAPLTWLIQMLLLAAPPAWLSGASIAPLSRVQRALQGLVLSYRDGEYNVSLAADSSKTPPELRELAQLHVELGRALREQRQHLSQRELLLDTVVQNTPVALVLSDDAERVVYANIAARQLLMQPAG
jgi:two-component system, NtrC family, nitrogen regulation sensor histidine kinase NtrY